MKLIPALSIKGGKVAVADGGRYTYVRNSEGRFRSPVNVLREKGFPEGEVFVLDLDGLERDSPDLDAVKRIAAYRDVWLDAGASDADGMMDLFVSDASKVVMGTLTLSSLDELSEALDMSDDIILSIAWDGGVVSPDPALSGIGAGALLDRLRGLRLADAMLLDLGSIKRGGPVDLDAVSALAGGFGRLFVSGRIAGGDLERLESAGAAGAIIDFRTLEGMMNGRA